MEKKMELENIFGMIIVNIKENGKIILLMELEFIIFLMEEFILEIGKKI